MGHSHNVRVVEMLARRGVKLVQFALVRHTQCEDLGAHRTDQVGNDRPSRASCRRNGDPGFEAHVLETSLPVQLAEPTADQRVRAVARERDHEELVQTIEHWVMGVVDAVLAVRLEAGYPPARASEADHLGEHLFWLGHVDQQRPGVNKIKRVSLKAGVPSVTPENLDVAHASGNDMLASHRDVAWIAVQPDDPPTRGHPGMEQIDDAARTAAEIDRAVRRP
jgi:hypothetical protein